MTNVMRANMNLWHQAEPRHILTINIIDLASIIHMQSDLVERPGFANTIITWR